MEIVKKNKDTATGHIPLKEGLRRFELIDTYGQILNKATGHIPLKEGLRHFDDILFFVNNSAQPQAIFH